MADFIDSRRYMRISINDGVLDLFKSYNITPTIGDLSTKKGLWSDFFVEENGFVNGNDKLFSMGIYSYTNTPSILVSAGTPYLEIGRYCSIATGLKFFYFEHPIDRFFSGRYTYEYAIRGNSDFKPVPVDFSPRTIIMNDVWIGQNVNMKQGITIGNGAVIAAGSVVTKSIPDYEIWGGNPAHFIKKRFSDDQIKALLSIKPWEYDIRFFKCRGDIAIDDFIDYMWRVIEEGLIARYKPRILTGDMIEQASLG